MIKLLYILLILGFGICIFKVLHYYLKKSIQSIKELLKTYKEFKEAEHDLEEWLE
jgi:uncharacterized membrane protein